MFLPFYLELWFLSRDIFPDFHVPRRRKVNARTHQSDKKERKPGDAKIVFFHSTLECGEQQLFQLHRWFLTDFTNLTQNSPIFPSSWKDFDFSSLCLNLF